jgi:hypothetical protein
MVFFARPAEVGVRHRRAERIAARSAATFSQNRRPAAAAAHDEGGRRLALHHPQYDLTDIHALLS